MQQYTFLLIFIFLGLVAPLQAQQKQKQLEQQQKSKQTTAPKPRPVPEPSRPVVNPDAGKLVLKIDSDMDCIVLVDEEERVRVKKGEYKKLPLPRGEFKLKFMTSDGMDVVEDYYRVTPNDVNSEKFYQVQLFKIRNSRLERESKDKAESDFNNALKESREQQSAGNFEAAQAAVQRALSMKPDHYLATDQLKTVRTAWFRDAMDKGDALFNAGKYLQAKASYESVLELAPNKEIVRKQITEAGNRPRYDQEIVLGDSLLRKEQFEPAKNAYRRASELTQNPAIAKQKMADTDTKAEMKRQETDRLFREQVAKQRQDEFNGYLNDIKTNMIVISGGTFTFGCQNGKDEGCTELDPKHQQAEVADFYLGKYEVTNREFVRFLDSIASEIRIDEKGDAIFYKGEKIYSLFCGETKSGCPGFVDGIVYDLGKNPGGHFSATAGMENKPVVMVTAQGAMAFCRWLSDNSGYQYHLPTEKEWEYAARGGKSMQTATIPTIETVSWYVDNSNGSFKEVGTKQADRAGLFDIRGNVMEWCGLPGNKAIGKGGSYRATTAQCSPGRRFSFSPANSTGFRLAMKPKY